MPDNYGGGSRQVAYTGILPLIANHVSTTKTGRAPVI